MEGKQPTERELRLEIEGLKQQLARLQATVAKRDGEISVYESLTKSIFSQTDQALVVCDPRGRIIRASQAARRLAGRDPLGLYFHEAFALEVGAAETVEKNRAESTADPLAAALAGEVRQGLEATLRREDGQVFHLRMNAAPSHEVQGQTSGALVVFQDITELKESKRQRQNLLEEVEAQAEKLAVDDEELTVQAEELRVQNEELQALMVRLEVQREELERATEALEAERALLRTVLEQMPGGVIIAAAPTGKFLLVNRQMSKILGHPLSLEDSLKNYTHYRLLYPDGRPLPTEEYPLARALAVGKSTKEEEIDFDRVDGAIRTLRVSAEPIRDRLGRIIAGVATYTDITERKQAEKALMRAKEEWELTFNSVPDLIAIIDREHRIVRVNRTMAEVLGAAPEDLEGRACHEIMHKSPAPPPFCPHSRLLADGREHVTEVHALGRDFLVSASPLTDDQGNLMGSVHVSRDITERHRAEEEIRIAHEKLRALIQASPLAIISLDTQGRVMSWNPAATRMFGWREDEVLGQPLPMVPEAEQEQFQGLLQRERAGESLVAVEVRRCKRDGTPLIVRLSSDVLRDAEGQITGFICLQEDITVQKEVEAALRQSQEDLSRAQAVAHTGSWRLDMRRNELLWSDETYRIFGIPQGTPLTYERFLATVHPEDREYVDQEWGAAIQGEPYDIEHRIVVDDAVKWVREKAELEFDAQGALIGGFGTVQDITGRKQAEAALQRAHDELEQRVTERTAELKSTVEQLLWEVEERQRIEASLRESEAMFRGTFDQSPVGAFMMGLDYRYKRVNEAFCRITGYSEAELLSLRFPDITHPDDLEEDMAQAQRLAAGDLDRHDREKRYIRKDGQATWVRLTVRLVSDAHGRPRHYLGIVQDINARKQAETALAMEKQRLTSVLEQIPAYVALVKPDHTIPFANREFVRRFGELGTKPCYEFFFGSSEPCENCKTFEALHTKSPARREWAGPDGNTYEIHDYPYTDIDGSPLILELGVDITARKEAEDQLRRQTAILEAINRVFRETLSCGTEAELGRICLTMAEELTGSQHGFICELNPEGKLDALAFSDLGWEVCSLAAGEPVAQREVSVKGLNLRVIQGGSSLMVNEPASHPEAAGFLEGQPLITSFLATPLKLAGQVIGFIGLANKAGGYKGMDQAAVEMLAGAIIEVLMRFRAEKKAASISRLYRLVSKVNEAIVRAADQDVLFRQVCRIAVEEGLFKMAWIGLSDRKSQSVKAVAQYGLEEGYLEKIKISLKGAESLGPTGTAVREGRYDICNDIIEDPRMAPWREQALERGYRSSGAFPLRVGSQVIGALTIYSGERGFFTEEEIGLLDSLAQDVSFAMESFDRESKRRQAVEALHESEERLRLLAAQLIAAQESERKRIAIELHDDLGQSLMVLKMQVREIAKLMPADSQETKELSIQVLDYIDGVVENVRRLSRDLMPSIMQDLGLVLAVKYLLENFCKYHEIECSLDLEDIQGQFTPEQEILIYRIFQESLTNVARHAQASQVRVTIKKMDESIYFSIGDNGRGFDLEEFLAAGPSRQSLGLASMEERVRMLNGVLEIWSQAGQGTRITFQVPLRQP